MYYPTHRPQLTGVPTESVDCGVRATQMALDWLSKGKVIRSVKRIRELGKMGNGPTNYNEWDTVIDTLGGKYLGFSGEQTNNIERAKDHMNSGGAVIWAVDYGDFRKRMQAKAGSLTFNGYHAILTVGSRNNDGVRQWRSFDSLLDGRYRGCPNGPVWVPQWKFIKSVEAVGQVYAVLLHRDSSISPIEPGDLLPGTGVNLADVLSELNDLYGYEPSVALSHIIDDLETLLGVTGNPEADASSYVISGVKVGSE